MQRLAFIFPGQGSQFAGMGRGLAAAYPEAEEVFARADGVLDLELSRLCFSGPDEELKKTPVTQPAVLAVSVAALSVLRSRGIEPDVVAGHSLGEYSALVAAGVLTLEDGLRLVRKRGQYMQESVSAGEGGMAAVLGLESQEVERICARTEEGFVEAANYNCPGQVVISGEKQALEAASCSLEQAGAKRVIPLRVSAPFHSSLLSGAARKLEGEIVDIEFNGAEIPVVCNCDAQARRDPECIKQALIRQVDSPVLWEDCMRSMLDMGVDTFLEVGPGKVLKGFVRRIDRKARVYTVGSRDDLQEFLERCRTREELQHVTG